MLRRNFFLMLSVIFVCGTSFAPLYRDAAGKVKFDVILATMNLNPALAAVAMKAKTLPRESYALDHVIVRFNQAVGMLKAILEGEKARKPHTEGFNVAVETIGSMLDCETMKAFPEDDCWVDVSRAVDAFRSVMDFYNGDDVAGVVLMQVNMQIEAIIDTCSVE